MHYTHPAEREAERLRTIIETMVLTQPHMTLQDAGPLIFEIEKKTAALEKQQVETSTTATPHPFPLPDNTPETGAKFIDLRPDIQREIKDGKKIQAIKLFRTLTGQGLKESKDSVQRWEDDNPSTKGKAYPPIKDSTDVARWLLANRYSNALARDVATLVNDGHPLAAIREVRINYPGGASVSEARDVINEYLRIYLT